MNAAKQKERAVFYDKLGRRLARLREVLGYSPESFAALIGYSTRAHMAYERGQRTQSSACMHHTLAVTDATGVSIGWLLTGKFGRTDTPNDQRPMDAWGQPIKPVVRLVV